MSTAPLLLRAGRPVREAGKALVLLHGRGASAESILPLAEALGAHDFAVLAPQAAGYQWYPRPFTAPVAQNEPYLSAALARLEALLGALETEGVGAERVVMAGFSQGACLASEFVARQGRRLGGLLALSGGLIGNGPSVAREMYPGGLAGTPVLLGCSDRDPHIPLARVETSAEVLAALGAEVELAIYPNLPHTINQDELERGQRLLARLG